VQNPFKVIDVSEITYRFQIRARMNNIPQPYWIECGCYKTIEEARQELIKYKDQYRSERNVDEDSRVIKVIWEVV
jgi:hypothetical protein